MGAFSIQGASVKAGATAIGGVTGFTLTDGERGVIVATSIADTSEVKIAGFPGAGSFQLNLNWDPANAGQTDLDLSRTQSGSAANRVMTITYANTDLSVATFTAFVKSISLEGEVNGVAKATAQMELVGAYAITV